jgi:hypothetical protein
MNGDFDRAVESTRRRRDQSGGMFDYSHSVSSDNTLPEGQEVWMTLEGLSPLGPAGARWTYAPVSTAFPLVGIGKPTVEPHYRSSHAGTGIRIEFVAIAGPFAAYLDDALPQWEGAVAARRRRVRSWTAVVSRR